MVDVKYHAPYRDPSGYGMAARYYIKTLNKLKVNVEAIPKGFWSGTYKVSEKMDDFLTSLEKKNLSNDVPLISHQTPTHFNIDYPGYKIGYTVHETSRVVTEWSDYMNKMDEIWTSSNFAKEVFINSGVEKEIYVVPHGVDRTIFNSRVKKAKLNISDDTFKFLSIFQWIPRKGPDKLLKAYYQEFSPDENVCLIIKTFGYKEGLTEARRIHRKIANIQSELQIENAPYVALLFDFLETRQMARLIRSADVFVLPSRGEAWGMPYLEAMSCGLPTIGTKWGGQMDFMNHNNSLLVEVDELSVVTGMPAPWFTPDQRWAEPCIVDLREKMRRIYEDKNLRKRLSRAGIATAKEWPWSRGAKLMKERLESI